MIIDNKKIDIEDYLDEEESVKSTRYFVESHHDFDAIMEYAKQKGFVTVCNHHDHEESFHFHDVDSVDEIVELAVSDGLFEFYQNNGTCYRLSKKGVQEFPHEFQGEQ